MPTAEQRHGRINGINENFFGSKQNPAPRRPSEATGAGAHSCVPHCSPRWSAGPLGPSGTGLAGLPVGPGPAFGPIRRHPNRPRTLSLAVGRHMHEAGGLQAGAPARSGGSARPLASKPLHNLRQLPLARAGTNRGIPASTHPNAPARDAGGKEEIR